MKVAFASKLTKLEWDKRRLGLTRDDLIKFYRKSNRDIKKIIDSHERQLKAREEVMNICSEIEVLDIPGLEGSGKARNDIDILICLGGDNYFQLCAHLFPKASIVGINSDPDTSSGILLKYDVKRFKENFASIINNEYDYEEWTKIKVLLNDKDMGDVHCTAALSIKATDMVSKFNIECNGISEEQIATGFLVVSGAGSGERSWYRNAGLYLPQLKCNKYEKTKEFEKTSKELHTLTREPIGGEDCEYKMLNLKLGHEDKLKLTYWSAHDSELSLDSISRFDVKEGDVLEFCVSDSVLRVIK